MKPLRMAMELACLVFALPACSIEPAGVPGALHDGTFLYCDAPSANCEGESLPSRIAVGATFSMFFANSAAGLSSSNEGVLESLPASDTRGAEFLAVHSGTANVEERDTDGQLRDYVSVSLVDPSALGFRVCPDQFNAILSPDAGVAPCDGVEPSTALAISRGSSLAPTVCIALTSRDGAALAGSVPVQWTRTPDSAADLELHVGTDQRCATVGGLTLGAATLAVTSGNLAAALEVTVSP